MPDKRLAYFRKAHTPYSRLGPQRFGDILRRDKPVALLDKQTFPDGIPPAPNSPVHLDNARGIDRSDKEFQQKKPNILHIHARIVCALHPSMYPARTRFLSPPRNAWYNNQNKNLSDIEFERWTRNPAGRHPKKIRLNKICLDWPKPR